MTIEQVPDAPNAGRLRSFRVAGHRRITSPVGDVAPRQPAPGGWLLTCECGWSVPQAFPSRAAAEREYSAHLLQALPVCARCKQAKPQREMSKASTHLCKTCRNAATREWAEAHPTEWERHARKSYLKLKYGLTVEEADALMAGQGGRCAICGKAEGDSRGFRMHIDHDHETGRPRGILCNLCNNGLGNFHDDPTLLAKAIAYLEVHSRRESA